VGERGSHLSVSQVKIADSCSLKWRYKYVDQLPAPEEAATKVFGTVVHLGIEHWYGPEEDEDAFRQRTMRNYVHDLWFEHLPMDVGIALRKCIEAEKGQVELEQALLLVRPTLKSPRTTKAFEESDQKRVFEDARDQLLRAADKCEDMRWPKDENAFQAYQKSMFIANQLEERWKRRPRPLVIEKEFHIEFAGIEIRGRIDQIRADPFPNGQIHTEGVDVKTGRQLMTQMDAFLQAFLYNEACYQDPFLAQFLPEWWIFWMARHNKPQRGVIDRERHGRIAKRILERVRNQIQRNDYAPQYSQLCSWCDYRGLCEKELSLWPAGTDGVVLDLELAA